jgi:Family of unknown function (DUF5681)
MSPPRVPKPPGDYVVGRGRPPVASRFQPGQSGNPKGRPRKGQDLAAILERALDAKVVIHENGRRRSITMREVIVRGIVNEAARRDQKAIRALFALLDRHPPGSGAASQSASSLTEDQAILADFLSRHSTVPSSRDAPLQDRQPDDATAQPATNSTQAEEEEP